MKKLICMVLFVVLALFTVSTASALEGFKVQKLYLEGTNTIEGNFFSGMDTPTDWNLEGVAKAELIKTPLGTLGAALTAGYTPDDAIEDVRVAGEVYVVPFNIPYLEVGVRHGKQTVDGFDISRSNMAFFRLGTGF